MLNNSWLEFFVRNDKEAGFIFPDIHGIGGTTLNIARCKAAGNRDITGFA